MPSPRRGYARQGTACERELILRSHIVEVTGWAASLGLSVPEAANRLHLAPRTLRDWYADFRIAMPGIQLLGRPTLRSSWEDRTAVLDVLNELGPAASVATLRDCFPEMPRVELTDLLKRNRRVWQKRYQPAPDALGWQGVGAVWAMVFSEAPGPIDGFHPYLLAVHDLASHQQLLWPRTSDMVAQTAIDALQMLFTIHGAPWS
jgi:hypothetical protein